MYKERTNEQRAKNAAHARLALKYRDHLEVMQRLNEFGVGYPARYKGDRETEGMTDQEYELELYYLLSKYE
jgi:hypothetical protein